jgi:Fic family protein
LDYLMSHGGHYVERTWPGNPGGQTRRERQAARYRAYVPDPIAEYEPLLTGGLSALLSEADAAVRQLNAMAADRAHQVEALARQLLRQESLASSRIEGLALSHRRIGRAAFDPRGAEDMRATAVLANIEAMHEAIALGAGRGPITLGTIVDLHRTLMSGVEPKIAGRVRDRQNWVGGGWHGPPGADFVPPPEDRVEELLGDLAEFMNRDDMPVSLQAALAHAQFETIHPFADGNGRIGRCLIHVIFKRRGIAAHHVPPVSLLMAADIDSYVRALTAYRDDREDEWSSYFAQTTIAAGRAAESLAGSMRDLQERWRAQANVRTGSAAEKIIDLLPAQPVIDVAAAARLAEISDEAARTALNALEGHGIVAPASKRTWGRVWEAKELFALLDRFERSAAGG